MSSRLNYLKKINIAWGIITSSLLFPATRQGRSVLLMRKTRPERQKPFTGYCFSPYQRGGPASTDASAQSSGLR